jgi:hypothetical protein
MTEKAPKPTPAPAPAQTHKGWEAFKTCVPIIQVIVAGLIATGGAYVLTGRITTDIQKRQLVLATNKEMLGTVSKLYADTLDSRATEASVRSLVAYGSSAVGPLVLLLQSGDATHRAAAENGLLSVATSDSEAVCQTLIGVIQNRTQLYSWRTQIAAVRILGHLRCQAARPALYGFTRLVGAPTIEEGRKHLADLAHPDWPPAEENVQQLWDELEKTKRLLNDEVDHHASS